MANPDTMAREFLRLVQIIADLRAPNGCPWDREQTHASLKPYLIEEAHEVCDAIDANSAEKLCEELGDLLMQPVLHAQLANEAGAFDVADVLMSISDKLVRRHPHVFGETEAKTSEQVLKNWEQIKQHEAAANEAEGAPPRSMMDGIPRSLPALYRAQRIQDKFARVGFDWPSIGGAIDKVREEFDELINAEHAREAENIEEELGDLFFALVNVARLLRVDAEQALQAAATKAADRFRKIEEAARAQGRDVREMTLAEMDAVWNESKRGT